MARAFRKERRQKSKAKAKAEKLFNRQFEATLALLRKRAVGRRSARARWVVIISELSTTLAVRARDAVPVAAEARLPKSRVADKSPFERTDLGLCARHFDLHRRGSLVLVSYGAAVLRGFAHARQV